jgi:hypothetical protein
MKYTIMAIAAIVAVHGIASGAAIADETTPYRTVRMVQINGTGQEFYFRATEGGWGAPSCPNAIYVYVTSDVVDRKLVLAAGMTAKAMGTRVQFIGNCLDQNYFKATYVILGD